MPPIQGTEIGIAVDMHGCPNRCRHCWLGKAGNGQLAQDDVRRITAAFRHALAQRGEYSLRVCTWFREPDFAENYRDLYHLEAELCDGPPPRFELASVWRLARDPGYAEWLKSVGPDTVQITFFGLEETTDWFYRRKGAFHDAVRATERLLEAGMKPRWQFFLTKKIVPELGPLLELAYRMRLPERVAALGGEFTLFMHAPGLTGEGTALYEVCATADDLPLIPAEINERSLAHFQTEELWVTEAERVRRFRENDDGLHSAFAPGHPLWFFITPELDLFANMGTLQPWWRLGNLQRDTIADVLARYEAEDTPALRINATVTCRQLAAKYGKPDSDKIVDSIEDYWFERYCIEEFAAR